jgi:hypothetical protein
MTTNTNDKLSFHAHSSLLPTSGSSSITNKKYLHEPRNHQIPVHRCNDSPFANTWLIAREIRILADKQQHSTQLSYFSTRKLYTPYFPITFNTQESYDRLGIDGEALNPNQSTPIPPSNGVPAHALHVNGLTPHVV